MSDKIIDIIVVIILIDVIQLNHTIIYHHIFIVFVVDVIVFCFFVLCRKIYYNNQTSTHYSYKELLVPTLAAVLYQSSLPEHFIAPNTKFRNF